MLPQTDSSLGKSRRIATFIVLAALNAGGCTDAPHPGRTVHITASGLMLDSTPVEEDSFRRTLAEDMSNSGPDIPFRIVASPEAQMGGSISQIARRGFRRLTFTVEGETISIAFMPRPGCVLGPPVHVITGIVSAAGTIATTNSPVILSGFKHVPLGTRVIFRATPDATGRALYDQMTEWQTIPASLFWDDDIKADHASKDPAQPPAEPQR